MDLSIFKIGGWNKVQRSTQHLLEEFIDENQPRLSIRNLSRDSFFIKGFGTTFFCAVIST